MLRVWISSDCGSSFHLNPCSQISLNNPKAIQINSNKTRFSVNQKHVIKIPPSRLCMACIRAGLQAYAMHPNYYKQSIVSPVQDAESEDFQP